MSIIMQVINFYFSSLLESNSKAVCEVSMHERALRIIGIDAMLYIST